MTKTLDQATLDQWYCIQNVAEIPVSGVRTRLLGVGLAISAGPEPTVQAFEDAGVRTLPVRQRYGYLWTTLGAPDKDVPDIPEAEEPDRRYVPCGAVKVQSSAPRVVENFLDMAHFPFVHTDILGSEEHPEVEKYKCETTFTGSQRLILWCFTKPARFRRPVGMLSPCSCSRWSRVSAVPIRSCSCWMMLARTLN